MKYSILAAAIFILLSLGLMIPVSQAPVADANLHLAAIRAAKQNTAVGHVLEPKIQNQESGTILKVLHVDKVVMLWGHNYSSYVVYYGAQVSHNIMVNGGADAIKVAIGTGTISSWTYIEPTNATMSASTSDTYCCGGSDKTFVTMTDLAPSSASYTSTGTGTCTIAHTFTETVAFAATVYGAGLTISTAHGGSANNLRAEANFSSIGQLNAIGDFIVIIWYITIPAG